MDSRVPPSLRFLQEWDSTDAAYRAFLPLLRLWKAPPFRTEREKDGAPDRRASLVYLEICMAYNRAGIGQMCREELDSCIYGSLATGQT